MDDFRNDLRDDIQMPKTPRPSFQMPPILGLLTPSQRLVLSVFLFMDICILAFAVLFLFGKVSLPV
jgi:hypothetical protein